MDPFSLLSPEVLEDMLIAHPWHFIGWSVLVAYVAFKLGYYHGRHKSGILTYYDLSKRQRSILTSLSDDGTITLFCDEKVKELVDQGLIADRLGYDVIPESTCTFVLTARGNRMLNHHPILRRLSSDKQ